MLWELDRFFRKNKDYVEAQEGDLVDKSSYAMDTISDIVPGSPTSIAVGTLAAYFMMTTVNGLLHFALPGAGWLPTIARYGIHGGAASILPGLPVLGPHLRGGL